MEREYRGIKINADYLEKKLNEKGITKAELSDELGYSRKYISNVILDNNAIKKPTVLAICQILDADYAELTTIKKKSVEHIETLDIAMLEVMQKRIERIESMLQKLVDSIESEDVEIVTSVDKLTDLENATLLLSQMTKYGSCQEDIYRRKAKEYNINSKAVTQAIDVVKCDRKVINGKMWLQK